MKRILLTLMIIIFVSSMLFIVIGCKEEAVPTEEAAAEEVATPAEEAAEEEAEETPVEQKKLVLWWWGETDSPGLEKYIDDSIVLYEKLNPGVKIEQVLQSTDDLIAAFKAAAKAQEGPDIATLWYGVYQLEEVWADNIEPIDNYLKPEETQHWIGKELSTYNGKLWGSDLYGYGTGIIYNKELFEKAGLDPENPPKTWDEFITTCETLKNTGIAPFASGFKGGGWVSAIYSAFFLHQRFDSMEPIKEAVIGKRSFTDEEFVDIWKRIDEMNKNNYYIKGPLSLTLEEARTEWRKGNAAFTISATPSALTWYNELGLEKMGFMTFPAITDKPVDFMPVVPITLFITKWSPHKELAADFLKFLHTEERINALVEQLGGSAMPVDDRFDLSLITDPQKRAVFEQAIEGFKKGTWFVDGILPYGILGDGILPVGQKVIGGEIGPEEAAQIVENAAKTWREQNPEALEKYIKWVYE